LGIMPPPAALVGMKHAGALLLTSAVLGSPVGRKTAQETITTGHGQAPWGWLEVPAQPMQVHAAGQCGVLLCCVETSCVVAAAADSLHP
jgi:hypothetical protein